jgi:tRNA 2-thiouridine synthesizing protein B
MLHTINKSPFERNSLETCLRLSRQNSSILLYEDAIYAAIKGTRWEASIVEALKTKAVYVLIPDLEARGMRTDNVIDGIKCIGYGDFVDLVANDNTVQAWV